MVENVVETRSCRARRAGRGPRALAYRLNAAHGVRVTTAERDALVAKLYSPDGKTQAQVATSHLQN